MFFPLFNKKGKKEKGKRKKEKGRNMRKNCLFPNAGRQLNSLLSPIKKNLSCEKFYDKNTNE